MVAYNLYCIAGKLDTHFRCACRALSEDALDLWLVGLAPEEENGVQVFLQPLGGRVLHYIPDQHWLVQATHSAINALLANARFSSVTVVSANTSRLQAAHSLDTALLCSAL